MVSLFAMCTAPALVPVFLGLTSEMPASQRKRTAWICASTVFVALVVMVFFGEPLFKVMGISLDAFRVGGGILILLSSIDMVRSDPPQLSHTGGHPASNNPGIVPLGIPIVAGPGLLAAMMVHSANYSGMADDLVLVAAALSMAIYVLISFLFGERVVGFLGSSGIAVITKISGLLLTAIGAGFIADGIKGLFPALA